MTVKYNYKCPSCEHTYIEQRTTDESPLITVCNFCSLADYVEVSKENLDN